MRLGQLRERDSYESSLRSLIVRYGYKTTLIHFQVVEKRSATLGLRGTRERQIPLDTDHSNICRFGSAEDDIYLQVAGNIEELVKEAVKPSAPVRIVNLPACRLPKVH